MGESGIVVVARAFLVDWHEFPEIVKKWKNCVLLATLYLDIILAIYYPI